MARRTKPDPFASKIGARVRALREEQGLTLEQVAYGEEQGLTLEKVAYGVEFSKGQLSTIEKGLAVPTASTLATLAEGLEVLPLDLLTFPEDSPREKMIDMTRGLSKKELEAIIALLRRRSEPAR